MAMTPDEASYVQALEAKVRELEAEIAKLELKIKNLLKEKGLSSARDGLTFNSHTGLWADPAGTLYCPTCLGDDKRNPIKIELPQGWRCSVLQRHYFSNPDYDPPNLNIGGGGPGGWMR